MYELKDKQKVVLSLWHWSHILQLKVLKAWVSYTAQKKRKTVRYAQAMDRHRAWLMGVGVRQWIKVNKHGYWLLIHVTDYSDCIIAMG